MKKLLTLLLSFACIFALASCSMKVEDSELFTLSEEADIVDTEFEFTLNGVTINNETMKKYNQYYVEVETINSKGKTSKYTFYGYRLSDVLRASTLKGKDLGTISFTTTDEYASTPYQDGYKDCLIALRQNNKTKEEVTTWKKEEGPRFCPCASNDETLYTKKVATITIEGLGK